VGFLETELDLHLTIYSRTDAMNWACRLGIADCVQRAREKYASQMAQPDNSRYSVSYNKKTTICRDSNIRLIYFTLGLCPPIREPLFCGRELKMVGKLNTILLLINTSQRLTLRTSRL